MSLIDKKALQVEQRDGYFCSHFHALASPCEVLIETQDRELATSLAKQAQSETLRIEHKFSRYRDDNIIYQINHSDGQPLELDDETAGLIDYAGACYELSNGLFDITSGVLGQAWRFDGQTAVPDEVVINTLLECVGWNKASWDKPELQLPKGMQIDLGGVGKEYAVDRVTVMLGQQTECSILVNFGGDLMCTRPKQNGEGWQVGIEQPDYSGQQTEQQANRIVSISTGGLATSGDVRRHIIRGGKRYGHILNPKTGWPVEGAPCSVTVAAATCTEAGILATLAMLQGPDAEAFLAAQEVQSWVLR